MRRHRFSLYLTFFILFSAARFTAVRLTAQETGQGLIFSEIYFDRERPEESWIEIYNPTDKTLILDNFFMSVYLMSDILPGSPYEIKPDDYLILCHNEEEFKATWGINKNVIAVDGISGFHKGGYISFSTKGLRYEAVRYGDPEISSGNADVCLSQILAFLKSGKSWSRKIKKTDEGVKIADFHSAVPTPGLPNKEK